MSAVDKSEHKRSGPRGAITDPNCAMEQPMKLGPASSVEHRDRLVQTSVIDLEVTRFRQAKDVRKAVVPQKLVRRIAEVTANRHC